MSLPAYKLVHAINILQCLKTCHAMRAHMVRTINTESGITMYVQNTAALDMQFKCTLMATYVAMSCSLLT